MWALMPPIHGRHPGDAGSGQGWPRPEERGKPGSTVNFAIPKMDYSHHPWRSRYAPPSAFAFAIRQTQSGLRRNDEQK